MTAQQLREKLTKLYNEKWREGAKEKQAIAEALIAIVCSQREALEFYSLGWVEMPSAVKRYAGQGARVERVWKNKPVQNDHGMSAYRTLAATDARLKAMGVL